MRHLPSQAPGIVPALACIGALPTLAKIDERSQPHKRRNALEWADGLVTSSGRDRGLAIAMCGRPAAAVSGGGSVGLVCLRCRDRACPSCQARRAANLSERLIRARAGLPGRWHFLTLTKRKMPAAQETAEQAMDEIGRGWRETFNKKYASGKSIAELCEGGVKAIEITARAPGEKNADGSRVRFFGWHAHIHVLVRLREGVDPDDFRQTVVQRWCEVVDARPQSQDMKKADDKVTRYLCKYVVKPLEKKVGRGRGRELFGALHGRRMLEGFYEMRSWKKLAPEKDKDPLLIAVQSLNVVWEERATVVFQGWVREHPIPSSRGPEWKKRQVLISVKADAVLDALALGTAKWWDFDKPDDPPPFVWRAGVESPAACPDVPETEHLPNALSSVYH